MIGKTAGNNNKGFPNYMIMIWRRRTSWQVDVKWGGRPFSIRFRTFHVLLPNPHSLSPGFLHAVLALCVNSTQKFLSSTV